MFPKSTELPQKFIAKEKFYGFSDFTAKLKAVMTNDIAKITASNKFSAGTLNIPAGKTFPEVMVIRIALKNKKYEPKLLDAMDKSIRAAFVLFILEFEGNLSASIAFKDKNGDNISLSKRWTTGWVKDLDLEIDGCSIDAVYESFIRQISSGKLVKSSDTSLKEKVVGVISYEKTERQVGRLETKMKNEMQLKKKLEIKAKIKKLKEQI
jgi:hypothetical protein